jgi:hypothetical protein
MAQQGNLVNIVNENELLRLDKSVLERQVNILRE